MVQHIQEVLIIQEVPHIQLLADRVARAEALHIQRQVADQVARAAALRILRQVAHEALPVTHLLPALQAEVHHRTVHHLQVQAAEVLLPAVHTEVEVAVAEAVADADKD